MLFFVTNSLQHLEEKRSKEMLVRIIIIKLIKSIWYRDILLFLFRLWLHFTIKNLCGAQFGVCKNV